MQDFSSGSAYPTGMEETDPVVGLPPYHSTHDIISPYSSQALLEKSKALPPNPQCSPQIDFKGKTVIITGAGAGLGRAYALMYGRLGANVVVNDVSEDGANMVVKEVLRGELSVDVQYLTLAHIVPAAGGQAIAAPFSAEDGEAIVNLAMERYGGVHVLVANAGILRDKSFLAMSEADWDSVIAVHLKGTFLVGRCRCRPPFEPTY